eukprot:jgi/Mesen1/3510/ME000197S02524
MAFPQKSGFAAALLAVTCGVLLYGGAVAQLPAATPAPHFLDSDYFQLALNLEHLEAEFYFFSAYGYGLDGYNASYNGGGPPPIGGQKANLSASIFSVAEMLALQEAGHIRIIREFLGDQQIPRPLIDVSTNNWNSLVSKALGFNLSTPFNPYQDDIHFLIAAFVLPYVGLTAYVGTNPNLVTVPAKQLRDLLDGNGRTEDEPILVSPELGAEGKTGTNVLAANRDSLSYARNGEETLRIVYGTDSASSPGGFFPAGANGNIPGSFLGTGPYSGGNTPLEQARALEPEEEQVQVQVEEEQEEEGRVQEEV